MKLSEVAKQDIMITLPKTVDWSEYERELAAVESGDEEMMFKVPTLPTKSGPGCKCYIVHNNKVVGWMNITNFYKGGFKCSTTGTEWQGNFIARSGKFNKIENDVDMPSFRGFRYVRYDENKNIV